MKSLVVTSDGRLVPDQKLIKQKLRALDIILGLSDRYLEVYLVGDAFMTKNVLSFAAPKNFPHPESTVRQAHGKKNYQPLGEIYLNPKYIKENNEDLVFMLVHGLLHLLGYDHKNKSDRMKMEAEEQRLCQALKS